VLACADGAANTTVARRYRTTDATVGKWRQRFIDRRLDGIYDAPRVGAPRTISDKEVETVIVNTLETTPAGATHRSTRTMAANAGMSHTTIGRIWRTFGLKPQVTESFKISPDPQLIEKVRDVVGLYMNPPTNAAVFSFD
jgi:transposase